MCDQAATNVCALKQLGFDRDYPQIHCHGVMHAVHVVFDVPHLLKNVRNNLQKYKIKVDESVASWRVAAQTLSHSVAAAVSMRILTKQLPPSAHGTADCRKHGYSV